MKDEDGICPVCKKESDRQGPVNARVAMDIIPIVSEQLRKFGTRVL